MSQSTLPTAPTLYGHRCSPTHVTRSAHYSPAHRRILWDMEFSLFAMSGITPVRHPRKCGHAPSKAPAEVVAPALMHSRGGISVTRSKPGLEDRSRPHPVAAFAVCAAPSAPPTNTAFHDGADSAAVGESSAEVRVGRAGSTISPVSSRPPGSFRTPGCSTRRDDLSRRQKIPVPRTTTKGSDAARRTASKWSRISWIPRASARAHDQHLRLGSSGPARAGGGPT